MRLLITRGEVRLEHILPQQKLFMNKSVLSVVSLILCVFCNVMPTKAERKRFSSQNKSKVSPIEHVSQYCRCDIVLRWLAICFVFVRKLQKYFRKSQHFFRDTCFEQKHHFWNQPFKLFCFVAFLLFSILFHRKTTWHFFLQTFQRFQRSENNFLIFFNCTSEARCQMRYFLFISRHFCLITEDV